MTDRRVAVRGGMFNTQVMEQGGGEPLLFLHGTTGLQPNPFLDALAQRFHVIAPLHPGIGESSGNDHLLDIHDLIYYYLDLLDAMNLRNLPIIGHSLGGMFAAELAAVQPERFSRLVLLAPFGLWNEAYPIADFFTMMPEELVAATFHDTGSPAARAAAAVPTDQDAYIQFMIERAKSLAVAAKYIWPIPNRGLARRLHRVMAPTLLVWGERDGIVPVQYGKDFQALIPGSQLEIVAGAGHLPQVEQPERLTQLVLPFLAGDVGAGRETAGSTAQ